MKIRFESFEIAKALSEYVLNKLKQDSVTFNVLDYLNIKPIEVEMFFGEVEASTEPLELITKIGNNPTNSEISEDTNQKSEEDNAPFEPDYVKELENDIFSSTVNGTALKVENSTQAAQDASVELPVQTTVETPPPSTEAKPSDPQSKQNAPTSVSQPVSIFSHLESETHRVGE